MARTGGGWWSERTRAVVATAALAAGVAALFVQAQRGPRPVMSRDAAVAARVLIDVRAWDAAGTGERRAAAVWVGATTPGMDFDRLETFGFEGRRHEMAVFTHAATGLEFSLIPGGTFTMGSPDDEAGRRAIEGPQHEVTIRRAFLLCRTETTQSAWERVTGTNPSTTRAIDHPAETVSWDDAAAFCATAGLRLPSEAEWEYACRAGTTTPFWSGDAEADLARVGWYPANLDPMHPWLRRILDRLGTPPLAPVHRQVAMKPANPFGLHDVHGNVWEWCEDAWHSGYAGAPSDGGAWSDGGDGYRVLRGGSWFHEAEWARSASRAGWPATSNVVLGFRPARSVGP